MLTWNRNSGKVTLNTKLFLRRILTKNKTVLFCGPDYNATLFANINGKVFMWQIENEMLGLNIKDIIVDEASAFYVKKELEKLIDENVKYLKEVEKEIAKRLIDEVYEEFKLAGIDSKWKQ